MSSSHPDRWLLGALALAALAFGLAYRSNVTYTDSDPSGCLLTSQALVRHGSLKLDEYGLQPGNYRFFVSRGHCYYYFPWGTSFLAAPVVAVANVLGMDMSRPPDDRALQKILSAATVAAALILLFLLGRLLTTPPAALAVAAGFTFGTSIMSSNGTALWSADSSLICVLGALLILIRSARGTSRRHDSWLLGTAAFWAFFCRPTSAPFVLLLCVYVFLRRRHLLPGLILSLALWSVAAALLSRAELGRFVPPYYAMQRLQGRGSFAEAIYGTLLSPSRGLLVYSPFLLLTFALTAARFRQIPRRASLLLPLLWFLMVWIVVSSFPHWWGGYCYGSRLLTDGLPPLALLTLLAQRDLVPDLRGIRHRLFAIGFFCTVVPAVWINSYQGLYNPATGVWNRSPDIDQNTRTLFDWSCPQFLATRERNEARRVATARSKLTPYPLGRPFAADGTDMVMENWYEVESSDQGPFRWSCGKSAQILFRLDRAELGGVKRMELELQAGSFGRQEVTVTLNDSRVGSYEGAGFGPRTTRFTFDAGLLRSVNSSDDDVNRIQFLAPEAASPFGREPGSSDRRILGVCLWRVVLRVAGSGGG